MNILVTGSDGFIGSKLVTFLETRGHSIEQFDIMNDSSEDVSIYTTVEQAVKRNDAVFHLAAITSVWNSDKQELFNVNIRGLNNVLRAAEQHDVEVIFTSSVAARNPKNLYAKSKEMGELSCEWSAADVKWVRLSNVIGHGATKGQVFEMVNQAVNKSDIEVWANGEIERSYITVDTVCERLYDTLLSEKTGFHGAFGSQTMTNLEMAEYIVDVIGDDSITISPVEKYPPSPRVLVVETIDNQQIMSGIKETVEFVRTQHS